MDEIAKWALESFEQNRKMAEEAVNQRLAEFGGHKHGIFCFKWRACRKMEVAVSETQQRVKDYTEAEAGIKAGDFTKAIQVLGKIAGDMEETPMQIATRVASSPPTLQSILSSPTGMAARLTKVRDHLVSLQCKNAPA